MMYAEVIISDDQGYRGNDSVSKHQFQCVNDMTSECKIYLWTCQ